MVAKILLTRHGETDYNLARRWQGRLDIPLNAKGLAQARAISRRLADFRIDAAYTSTLQRAFVTADMILEKHHSGVQAKRLEDLCEADGGLFEGLNYQQMNEQYPEAVKLWQADRVNYGPPEGETLKQVVARVIRVLDLIQQEHPEEDKNVLVVAHGGINGVMLCHLMGMDLNRLWQWRFDNCSLTIVDLYHDKSILSLFNDTSHITSLDHKDDMKATESILQAETPTESKA